MRLFRLLFGDRSACLALLAILVQLLVLQSVSAATRCAAMDAKEAAGLTVICTSDPAGRTPSEPGMTPCMDCPCAIGCSAGAGSIQALAPGNDIGPAFEPGEIRSRFALPAREPRLARAPPALNARPRGPPPFSVS